MIQIRLLGPVVVEADDGPIALHGLLEMALLARLALEPGRPVLSERLIDDLWGERVGRDPASSLWTLVRRLRLALGPASGVVRREGRSYVLEVPADRVDIGVFEITVSQAHVHAAPPGVDGTRALLREALGLWRGEPLTGLENFPFYGAEEARLTAARLALVVELADADLAAGDHAKVASELEGLVVKYPFEERLWALLMMAQYRCGSQTAALRTGSKLRVLLAEQLGIAPSHMVQSLEQKILAQDPALDWSAPVLAAPNSLDNTLSRSGEAIGIAATDEGYPHRVPEVDGRSAGRPAVRQPSDNGGGSNNFPRYLSTFIGRHAELADISYLFSSFGLITLTGPGGSGKTRLAVRAAAEMSDKVADGAWFVDLAPVVEPASVVVTVARTLGIGSQAGPMSLDLLAEILSDQNLLIVLDNCEHLVAACAELAYQVQQRCHRVRLVATSREPLGVEGERVYRVRPLSLPPEDVTGANDLEGSDAVELFVERVRTHGSELTLDDSTAPVVASICRRLDGIPFAIELAAARVSSMSLVDLNERLDQRFRLLTWGARHSLPRHQTLRAIVDWSFELLDEDHRTLLRRLSVFVAGFDLEAAEAVCATDDIDASAVADLVGSLVYKNLVVAEHSSELLRYRLLETIRQYAAEQLAASGSDVQARDAHAAYYTELAKRAAPELIGPHQGLWLKRLDLDWDNLLATFAYLYADPGRTAELFELGVAQRRFLFSRGHQEPIAYLRGALQRTDQMTPALLARAVELTGYLVVAMPGPEDRLELATARALTEGALELARGLDDKVLLADVLTNLCWVAFLDGALGEALVLGREAIEVSRDVGDLRLVGWALLNAAFAAPAQETKAMRSEALGYLRTAGDTYYVCQQLRGLAFQEASEGNLPAARRLYEEAITAAEDIGATWVLPMFSSCLGLVLIGLEEFGEAARVCRDSLRACRRQGRRSGEAALAIFILACSATAGGEYTLAARLSGAHDNLEADLTDLAGNSAHYWKPSYGEERDANRSRLTQALGQADFEADYRAGGQLNFQQAVDLALGRLRLS